MKTIAIIALLAIITGIIMASIWAPGNKDDLNGYMPGSNYIHSEIIDTLN